MTHWFVLFVYQGSVDLDLSNSALTEHARDEVAQRLVMSAKIKPQGSAVYVLEFKDGIYQHYETYYDGDLPPRSHEAEVTEKMAAYAEKFASLTADIMVARSKSG